MAPTTDPRLAAFCSPARPEVFHAVAHRNDIWRADPFDVESIHDEARTAFQRLVARASAPAGASTGRILLLLGEAGSGKTHLMRAFRNWTHSGARGYYGYLQMTSSTDHYGRYILNNLIDSLDQPYYEPSGTTSGLMRLSTALAESSRDVPIGRLQQLREDELDQDCLAKLIDAFADQIVVDARFNDVDIDLIRALLFLQRDDPRIKGRVLKYLRCEDLSDADRALLGGIVPRRYADAPQWVIERLGKLMMAVESAPLILCVDQIEDIYSFDEAPNQFRRALAALSDVAGRLPSAVIVISCLEDFYATLKQHLTRSLLDRIEQDPRPIRLRAQLDESEAVEILEHRLHHLYDSLGAPFQADDPTYPIPREELAKRARQRSRDILAWCQEYRERCIEAKGLVAPVDIVSPPPPPPPEPGLAQAWNDHRSAFTANIPVEEESLAAVLAEAIAGASGELDNGESFEAETHGRMISVERHGPDNAVVRALVGVCNKGAQGGALGRQIAEVTKQAGDNTPVIVRSTEFPTNPKAAVVQQLGALIAQGGRRAVVEDSDWRAMLAMKAFRAKHSSDPSFVAWLKQDRPLSLLKSLQVILGLDQPLKPAPAPQPPPEPQTPATPEPGSTPSPASDSSEPSAESSPIIVGTTNDRAATRVTLESAELTRHAAYLGSPGSGKTTLALNIIEQLLLQGVPAILVDRKGDLCGYARSELLGPEALGDGLEDRRRLLRERIDVILFTPGNPNGRPLSIAIAPAGIGLLPTFEREQVAKYAASALAGMMSYSVKGADLSRVAVLFSAINLLCQFEPDTAVSLNELIRFIAEADPSLLNAVGRLDTKLFERLVQDLETLRLTRGSLLAAEGEQLDAEALLGLGRHAVPGKTRLSIVSTKFLGAIPDVQFWVSQLLVELTRWTSRLPSSRLQAILFFDEADLYLPALRQPPTKEPMENLLRRARSAGLGLFLATQSPGDFDYRCRDMIRTWFVGQVKQETSLNKMKPMLSECRIDITSRIPVQETGQFHLIRDGMVTGLRADRAALNPEQIAEDEILTLARRTRRP